MYQYISQRINKIFQFFYKYTHKKKVQLLIINFYYSFMLVFVTDYSIGGLNVRQENH